MIGCLGTESGANHVSVSSERSKTEAVEFHRVDNLLKQLLDSWAEARFVLSIVLEPSFDISIFVAISE